MVLSVNSSVPSTGWSKNFVPTTSATPISMEAIMPTVPSSSSPSARRASHTLAHCMPYALAALFSEQLPPACRHLLRRLGIPGRLGGVLLPGREEIRRGGLPFLQLVGRERLERA